MFWLWMKGGGLRVFVPSRARAAAPGEAVHEEGVYAAAGGGEEARRDGDPRGHADHHHRHRQEQARVRRRVRRRPPRVPPQTRALLLAGTRALASVALASLPRSLRLR